MQVMRIRSCALPIVAGAALLFQSGEVAAQVDVAGTWALVVTTDYGVTNPTVTFEQDGEDLTGRYASETLGQSDVSGSVDGSEVTWRFEASSQGQAFSVVYRGTVDDDGVLTGTIDLADGLMTGTFRATRSRW